MDRKSDELLQHFEFKRKLRNIKVSTDDFEVRMHLRQLKHPICCFGEDEADRRERLRQIIAKSDGLIPIKRKKQSDIDKEQQQSSVEDSDKVWYHQGSDDLLKTRKFILKYSFIEGFKRRCRIKEAQSSMNLTQRKALSQEYHKKAREIECVSTITCAVRPLSSCEFSPKSNYLATGSWDGNLRIFTVPDMKEYMNFSAGHSARMSSVVWNPKYGESETLIDLVSSDHDGVVKFWSMSENKSEAIGVLEGLEGHRVGKLGFHPSGNFLATPSYDKTWRLWDLTTGTELLLQEGHTGAVTDCKFHSDGNLLISCDMAGYARIWDIRTGRCVFFMEGHAGPVLCCDWSSRGCGGGSVSRMVATGSEDGSTKLWDLRGRLCAYTIAAHASSVTAVKFQSCNNSIPGSPHFICTASIDRTARLWAHPVWTPLKELTDHAEKIMSMDVSQNGKYLATAAHNRNIKLWQFPD